jgi:acyl-CoA thioester hydrolase
MELPVQPLTADYAGPVIVLVDLRIQFLAEVRPGSEVRVGTRVQRIGSSSVTIGQAVFADGECAAVGEAVEVLIDAQTRRPTPWPDTFRELFSRYQRATGSAP